MSDTILVERDGDIATVILNRPEKLNAISMEMWTRLGEAVGDLSSDNGVRCIVLRGAGDKAFSPGADISEFSEHRATAEQGEAYGKLVHGATGVLRDCPIPTVAMIKGICVGGGLEVASLCDLRICGESSRFGAQGY